MVHRHRANLTQCISLQILRDGMAPVSPAEDGLVSIRAFNLVPCNLAAAVFGVVPLYEAAVTGYL